jgi:hypothetical protein
MHEVSVAMYCVRWVARISVVVQAVWLCIHEPAATSSTLYAIIVAIIVFRRVFSALKVPFLDENLDLGIYAGPATTYRIQKM